jgi:glutathione peroxidase
MTIAEIDLLLIDGTQGALALTDSKVTLVVNVASQCGLTPQYEGLVRLHDTYLEKGLVVLGVPCNQFMAQEPGSHEEISTFCSNNYGVDFPMTEKIEVNGEGRHALYEALTPVADSEGHSGDIRWNFEKFLIGRDGAVIGRFSPTVEPGDEAIISAIEAALIA